MKYIRLGESEIPTIPFLWYREQELVCPIEKIEEISYNNSSNNKENIYKLSQLNVLPDANLYICLHSLLFNKLNPDIDVVPGSYAINVNFVTDLISDNITVINNNGSVNIHDSAFSPCGSHCFKLIDSKKNTEIICNISCPEYQIDMKCVFYIVVV